MSQCEWTHCCFGLIRHDKWGVNRFPSLGLLKSPLESMGHTPVRLCVYEGASLLPLQQDTGYSYSHHVTANSNKATPKIMQLTPRSRGKWRMMREAGPGVCDQWVWGKACQANRKVCVSVSVPEYKPVCWTEGDTREEIPAASVADKLQGLAGTSGAQVALSIRDQAHWSVVCTGAGANSWTLALSAPHHDEVGGG